MTSLNLSIKRPCSTSIPSSLDASHLPVETLAASDLASLQTSLLTSLGLRIRHQVHRLGGHHQGIRGMALSPDHNLLATGSRDHSICLWDYPRGLCLRTLLGHDDWVWGVAFSPDGQRLASCGGDGRILLWEVSTGKILARKEAHTGRVYSLAFSNDFLHSVGRDGFLKAWDGTSLAERWAVKAHEGPCRSLALRRNVIHTAGEDGALRGWNAETGLPETRVQEFKSPLYAVCGHPEMAWLFVGGADGLLVAVDADTGQTVRTYRAHTGRVRSLDLDPATGTLVSGSDDGTDAVWDADTGILKYRYGNPGTVVNMARFSEDGCRIWFGSGSRVGCLDFATGSTQHNFAGFGQSVLAFAYSKESDCLVAVDWDGTVGVWQLSTERLRVPMGSQGMNDVKSLAMSRDGMRYAMGDGQGRIQIHALPSTEVLARFRAHPGAANALAFSADGQTLFTGHRGFHDNIRAWDLDLLLDPGCPAFLEDETYGLEGIRHHPAYRYGCWAHNNTVFSLELSEDGNLLVSGGSDGSACIWNIASAHDPTVRNTRILDAPILRLGGHPDWVRDARFSRDGTMILTGCNDGKARLFDTRHGTLIRTFEGCAHHITSVDLSPDNTRVLAGSWDRTLRTWDKATGQLLWTWERNGKSVVGAYRSLLADPKDGVLICGGDREIRCFRPGQNAPFRVLDTQAIGIWALVPIAQPDRLVIGSHSRFMELAPSTGHPRWLQKGVGLYQALATNVSGSLIAHGTGHVTGPSIFNVFSLLEGRDIHFCQSPSNPRAFAFLPKDRSLLAGCEDGGIYQWDLGPGGIAGIWNGHDAPVTALAVSRDGRCVVSASEDCTLRVWDPIVGRTLHVLRGHDGAVRCVRLEGSLACSGSGDGTVRIWDLESGTCLRVMEAGAGVCALALSPDGEALACGQDDGRVRVWSTSDGTVIHDLCPEASHAPVTGLVWNERHLVCALESGALTFQDVRDCQPLATFQTLERGFLWTTPPDEAAPSGWFWTDRPELIQVVECEEDGSHPRVLAPEDPQRLDHVRLYNSERMVLLRLNDPDRYRREVASSRRLSSPRTRPSLHG